ncbi:class I SAM-dependent methyltransferase [Sedimentitalea sp. HM32M-2]|uniref:class I SAM-dependent methyltransferase n=1 Tax=Sedimentitalea sp. HM32M-2 TaxID=3351566 RepID=UPI00363D1E5F
MDIAAVQKSYARWAPVYDKTFGAITRAGRRRAVDYINTNGQTVLEIGIGTGLSLPHYRPEVQVTGVDASEEMLQKARERVRNRKLDHVKSLRNMDARDLDFPDNHFDVVAAMHIVSVVPDPEKVVSEMARVCKPGGKVVITNHFAREAGVLAVVERMTAPFANLLGWHSDFDINRILQEDTLSVAERQSLPPIGLMTFLVLEKAATA